MNESEHYKSTAHQDNLQKNEDNQTPACAGGCAGCGAHSRKRTATVFYIIALAAVITFAILISKLFG
jgi:hypothetical protein